MPVVLYDELFLTKKVELLLCYYTLFLGMEFAYFVMKPSSLFIGVKSDVHDIH